MQSNIKFGFRIHQSGYTFEELKNLDMKKTQICEVMIDQDDSLEFIKQFK